MMTMVRRQPSLVGGCSTDPTSMTSSAILFKSSFPAWLSPVQAVVLTVTNRNISHGQMVLGALLEAGIRVEGDFRNEKLGLKVREAQIQKMPYMLIIGDRESEEGGVTPRLRNGKNLPSMSQNEVIDFSQEECKQRR